LKENNQVYAFILDKPPVLSSLPHAASIKKQPHSFAKSMLVLNKPRIE
jgi:hypothetical protein